MWYLTSESDARVIYVSSTTPAGGIVIGRKTDDQSCNFAIQDDPSISRKHAALTVAADGSIFVHDLGSRYGTFVNNARLDGTSKLLLDNNDIIKFGKMGSLWKVHQINFVTCTSTLKGENLQTLKQCLVKLGGVLKNDWDESCVYLTMPAITLTIKVVLALVQGANIVDVKYWNKCLEAFNNSTSLPNPNDYTPKIIESTLNKETVSFLPNNLRKNLFQDKKIIFFSKRQMDMYKMVLEKSSGTALLLSASNLTKAMLCEKNVIVIQYNLTGSNQDTESQRSQINDIVSHLTANGKRVVADAEIGLAILFCSLVKYCNPDFNFSSEVIKQSTQQNIKSSNVLAPETQESQNIHTKKENVIIDESLVSKTDISSENLDNSNSKRKYDGDFDVVGNANKKQATEVKTTENSKRKQREDDIITQNSKKMATESNMDEDMFNFDNSSDKRETTTSEKKLNLAKPLKRKLQDAETDDDLFNFVEDKRQAPNIENEASKAFQNDVEPDEATKDMKYSHSARSKAIETVDVAALRGIKLKELQNMQHSENYIKKEIKKEVVKDELDEKMGNLDLGTTVITIKKNLIVKKEPLEISEQENYVKNFKKFKKVWPIKMQVTVIPKSEMSTVSSNECEQNSLSYTQN